MSFDVVLNQLHQSQDRARILENSARLAYQTSAHRSSGAGWSAPKDPLYFDTKFVAQPAVFHGSWMSHAPDYKHYRFPQVTGGVTDWIVQDGLYVGAHLFFSVLVDPIIPPRTNGSDLATLTTRLAQATDVAQIALLKVLVKEATEAVYLLAHPAKCVIEHQLLFMAVGLKGMPSDVEHQLHADSALTPLTPPIYSNS